MINFRIDFSYLDELYILRRKKKYKVQAKNIFIAISIIETNFFIINIRNIKQNILLASSKK